MGTIGEHLILLNEIKKDIKEELQHEHVNVGDDFTEYAEAIKDLRYLRTYTNQSYNSNEVYPDLPDLTLLITTTDEEVAYFTYDVSDKDSNLFWKFYPSLNNNTVVYKVDLGHIENGKFILDKNLLDNAKGLLQGLFDITEDKYTIIRLTTTGHFTLFNNPTNKTGNYNTTINSLKIVEVCASLPYIKNVQYIPSSYTQRVHYYNLHEITSFNAAFTSAINIIEVYFHNTKADKITTMTNMFADKKQLKIVDMSCFEISQLCTNLNNVFLNCYKLTELYVDFAKWDTSKVSITLSMFYSCMDLTFNNVLNIESLNLQNATSLSGMFYGCYKFSNKKHLDLTNWKISNKCTNFANLFCTCTNLESVDLTGWDISGANNLSGAFSYDYNLRNIKGIFGPTNMKSVNISTLFLECYSLIDIDLSNWTIEQLTGSLNSIFSTCKSLQSVKLGNFGCQSITSTSNMFVNCVQLKLIDMSKLHDVLNLNMASMFNALTHIETIKLPKEKMMPPTGTSIFAGGMALKEIVNFEYLDLSNATDALSLFQNCRMLEHIDLSTLNISAKCKNINNMFNGAWSLKEVIFPETWDLSGITTFNNVIYLNRSLEKLIFKCTYPVIALPLTTFVECSNLKEIDLTPIDFSKVASSTYSINISSCYPLKHFKIAHTLPSIANITFGNNYWLTIESLRNIILYLPICTTTRSITFGLNVFKLSEQDIIDATAKNWTVVG